MSKDTEIKKNLEEFKKILPGLLAAHPNKHVLMRDGKVIAIHSTAQDAVQTGLSFYKDGLFSVQKITDEVVDVDFFSYALN